MTPTTCAACGGANAPGLAFCTHCGTPAAPPAPPPPAPPTQPAPVQSGYAAPPAYAAPPPRPRRTGTVALWVVLVLAVVGGGVGGGLLLLDRDPDPGSTTADSRDRDRDPAGDRTDEPEPSGASTGAEPAAAPVRCWNGPRPTLADCTEPEGRRGIRWVFPSMRNALCTAGRVDRLQIWNCYDDLDDGTVIRFNYSEWDSFASAAAHYRDPSYRGGFSETRLPDGRLRWFSYDQGKAQFKAAFLYEGDRWSVTIYADTEEQRAAAIRDLLVMRPADELRGVG